MFVLQRTVVVQKGFADKVVERFGAPGILEQNEGFIDLSVMVKEGKRGDEHDEVLVVIRWDSKDAWKNWEKSDAHIQGHREKRGKPQPEFIVSTAHAAYEVKAVKTYRPAESIS